MVENVLNSAIVAQIDSALTVAHPDRHSYFQLKHIVIGKEYTTQGKMWQCLRELKSRKSSLVSLEREIEETKDRRELIDIQREKNEQTLKLTDLCFRTTVVRENEIKGRQLDRQDAALKDNIRELTEKMVSLQEEAVFFLDALKQLRAEEDLKPMDDVEAQKQYWSERLSNEVHLKILLRQPLDTELVKTVMALHDESPIKRQVCAILAQSQVALGTQPER